MQKTPFACRLLAVSALFWVVLPALRAQTVAVTEYEGAKMMVRGARGISPVVEKDGRRVVAEGRKLALLPVEEYLPVFISVQHVKLTSASVGFTDSAIEMNNQVDFYAVFESPYALENVFVVLDIDCEEVGRIYFLYEIGRLEPREQKVVNIHVPMSHPLGQGLFRYHIFVDGLEALHSGIPVEQREAALDKMVAKRVASVQSSPLALLLGPAPEYPDRLRRANARGRAVIAVHVTATGRPVDASVKEATDPACGEAALAAVRMWRFLPVVKNGRPVQTVAEIPFEFGPPPPKAAK